MLVIANFKQNLNLNQLKEYFTKWRDLTKNFNPKKGLSIVFCPSAIYLEFVNNEIRNIKGTYCGIQNISPYTEGAYTGEIGAKQARDYAQFCIIGHSERRSYFKETNNQIEQKVKIALQEELIPIVCISKKEQVTRYKNVFYAYEPIENIGTGKVASLDKIKTFIDSIPEVSKILYGGSVNTQNISDLLSVKELGGFLVGTSSLNPKDFFKIIETINRNIK